MRIFKVFLMLAIFVGVAGCSSKFKSYNGPEVTQVVVHKGARKMHLMHHDEVLKSYRIGLGFAPSGHKNYEGDGRTPEGSYVIDRRNPNSEFHLSVGISYPNPDDRKFASSQGKSPGGDIFIHGRPWKNRKGGQDWTAGCIAVTNREIEEIYAMVRNGTPITITP
ncbi:L,D-transpeptidase family protein [Alisedimentitalea sp. MJ-SS2]|uniref:L,D-transpeptidase family protein n=1 Tax=Aliisedimentitalea sp. MJ-SS2 TaxID=3049795 RepID=UPI0029095657|nr:L,D-transpeptidase family protein [Alisedimentitalea sp. MJ-SS2]MDU8927892.1 L,D-transpeptidase family protein [Alisedimentitalea sp. MJ-SS2]